MAEDRLPLANLQAKTGDADFLCSATAAVVQLIMEADVERQIDAARNERTADRLTYCNDFRDPTPAPRLGSLALRNPKLRQGCYFPPFLETGKTSEKALLAAIQETSNGGVSHAGCAIWSIGLSKFTVPKLCKDIDERLTPFLDRRLEGDWLHLWLDATSPGKTVPPCAHSPSRPKGPGPLTASASSAPNIHPIRRWKRKWQPFCTGSLNA